ncbi:MAG: hypothetical protein A2163_03250 [Actinobacteria bacterium RBG_13_35_12]|nr:MAG: hypothetical protein A2163_03250 [Actinobacteria bacterium RBG_13_35_12]
MTCPNLKCKKEFSFDYKKYLARKKLILLSTTIACFIVLAAVIISSVFLLDRRNIFIAEVKNEYESQFKKIQDEFTQENISIKESYDNEIKKIDVVVLKTQAAEHYKKIWEERKSYSSKYAITPREKAQLEMLALSKDKTKSIEDIIRGITIKAAPDNSTVNVLSSASGYSLDIDFDMSELSSGEEGTRTKHDSIDSLKKEIIRLVSKVTNDVFEFCQNMGLKSIAIGCRHYVRQYDDRNNYIENINEILYKISLNKKDLGELKDNPFLEIYLTTKYFKVEVDEFPNLSLEITEPYTYEPIKPIEPIPYKPIKLPDKLPEPIKLPELKLR